MLQFVSIDVIFAISNRYCNDIGCKRHVPISRQRDGWNKSLHGTLLWCLKEMCYRNVLDSKSSLHVKKYYLYSKELKTNKILILNNTHDILTIYDKTSIMVGLFNLQTIFIINPVLLFFELNTHCWRLTGTLTWLGQCSRRIVSIDRLIASFIIFAIIISI